ncbi:MAG: hypothetical protein MUF09_08520 [Candidatus Nanopelagicales bacterium]|nr:hypothetical protein [Candidatus Nanopelagicales bacterium]
MNGVVDRVASVLERRFLLVAFLPTLIFGVSVGSMYVISGPGVDAVMATWNGLTTSIQIGFILASLAAVWLVAGFVDSQTRNLTQLFEGYTLMHLFPRAADAGIQWHLENRQSLLGVTVTKLPTGEGSDSDASDVDALAVDLPDSTAEAPAEHGTYAEEFFIQYTTDEENVLPTTLGNILRAAEDYSVSRYGADYLLVWPRLAHVCSERFVQDYEAMRADVDFLLVVSFFSGAFSLAGGAVILVNGGHPGLFVGCVLIGATLAHLAYLTAVSAAKEYGEQMRASVDLFRLQLLKQLGFPTPSTPEQENRMWGEFQDMLQRGHKRATPYSFTT